MNSTMKKRSITAVIFITVMIFGLFFSSYTFIILMCLIIGGSIWEFLSIACEKNLLRKVFCIVGGVSIALQIGFSNKLDLPLEYLIHVCYTIIFVTMLLCIIELSTRSTRPYQNIASGVFSLIYYALFISSIFYISFENGIYNAWLVFALIALTWTNDTMAYVVGSRIGKNKMFPRMSPNKTWEGTFGGIIFTVIAALIFYHFLGQISIVSWIILSLIIGTFGSLGDIIESMLKRSLSVKDTGNLLPGHGGLLDRFDSFTFHIPLSVYFIELSSSF